jgi:hypothetical protein
MVGLRSTLWSQKTWEVIKHVFRETTAKTDEIYGHCWWHWGHPMLVRCLLLRERGVKEGVRLTEANKSVWYISVQLPKFQTHLCNKETNASAHWGQVTEAWFASVIAGDRVMKWRKSTCEVKVSSYSGKAQWDKSRTLQERRRSTPHNMRWCPNRGSRQWKRQTVYSFFFQCLSVALAW